MANDKFVMSARQAAELDHAFERNGWLPEDVKKLSAGPMLADVRKVLLGHASIVALDQIIDCDAEPFIPEGWEKVEHRKGGQFKWDSTKVLLWLAAGQKNNKTLCGETLRKAVEIKSPYNANVLDYLLAHPHLIPEEWKGKYVFFWGTIYSDRCGRLCVRYLDWYGGWWHWSCRWLGHGWHESYPAALRAS